MASKSSKKTSASRSKSESSKSSSTIKQSGAGPERGEPTPPTTQATTSLRPPDKQVSRGQSAKSIEEAAADRVKGRTSDSKTRKEGTTVTEVPPDLSAGTKSTDAGDEAYPFPPQGDVDIASVPDKAQKGEFEPPIPVGAWVRLGKHKDVDERFEGHVAEVTVSPTYLCNCDYAPRTHEHQSPDVGITIRLRDETSAILTLPREAFSEVSLEGRVGLLPMG